jgi:transcriptional regulator with XRE-family HTH domain
MPRGKRTEAEDDGSPNEIDVHVGARVRLRRTLLGLTQASLGERLGLTFQQVQKYERGANRISASKLYALSGILDVPVSFFFDDLPSDPTQLVGTAASARTSAAATDDNVMARRETLELVRGYYKIADPKVRKQIFELFKATARMATGISDATEATEPA